MHNSLELPPTSSRCIPRWNHAQAARANPLVESLYFLRPKNGRLMLRNELRIGVKFDEQMAEA